MFRLSDPSLFVEFAREHFANAASGQRIHHRIMIAIHLIDLDSTIGVRGPGAERWLGAALAGYEKQDVAGKPAGYIISHYVDVVSINLCDRLAVALLEGRMNLLVAMDPFQYGL